jgi:VWFA-related protein
MSRFGSVFFILPLCLPISAFAQQSAAPGAVLKPPAMAAPQTSALSPRAGAESAPKHAEGQIKLDVVVTDKSGKPVSGLKLEDFELLDNKLPATILSFQAFDAIVQKADSPVEVILVIDTVNMPFTQVSNVRQEIAKFLLENGGHLAEPVSLMVLTNTGVSAGRQPSSDGIELAAEVARQDVRLRSETRAAGVYGAIDRFQLSIKMLTNIAASEAKKPGRKLLIWAGSGWPMLTGPNIETSAKGQREIFNTIVQLSDKLRQARISVYSVAQ